jgi:hypothetical protein
MLTKQELISLTNNYVMFCGFSDRENILQNPNIKTRVDWHATYYLFNRGVNLNFPYDNTICKVIGQCEDGSIECEFEPRNYNGDINENEEKAIMAFEYADSSNGLINYSPMFERIQSPVP